MPSNLFYYPPLPIKSEGSYMLRHTPTAPLHDSVQSSPPCCVIAIPIHISITKQEGIQCQDVSAIHAHVG